MAEGAGDRTQASQFPPPKLSPLHTSSHTQCLDRAVRRNTDILDPSGRRPELGTEGGLFISGSPISEGPHTHFCPDSRMNSPRASDFCPTDSVGLRTICWNPRPPASLRMGLRLDALLYPLCPNISPASLRPQTAVPPVLQPWFPPENPKVPLSIHLCS